MTFDRILSVWNGIGMCMHILARLTCQIFHLGSLSSGFQAKLGNGQSMLASRRSSLGHGGGRGIGVGLGADHADGDGHSLGHVFGHGHGLGCCMAMAGAKVAAKTDQPKPEQMEKALKAELSAVFANKSAGGVALDAIKAGVLPPSGLRFRPGLTSSRWMLTTGATRSTHG